MREPVTLYKVVRDDYTDCYSGTVMYVVGETIRHPRAGVGEGDECVYHACASPEDVMSVTLGELWPLRLLEISSPEIVCCRNRFDLPICCVQELTVLRELPIERVFGSQGYEVMKFINEINNIKQIDSSNNLKQLELLVKEHQNVLSNWGIRELPVKVISDLREVRNLITNDCHIIMYRIIVSGLMKVLRRVAFNNGRLTAFNNAGRAAYRVAGKRSFLCEALGTIRNVIGNASYITCEDVAPFRNPFTALVEILKLGYWPIGTSNENFIIYNPIKGE